MSPMACLMINQNFCKLVCSILQLGCSHFCTATIVHAMHSHLNNQAMRFGQKICTTTYIICLACLHATSIFSVEDLKRNLTQLYTPRAKPEMCDLFSKLSCTGLHKPLNNSYSPVTNNKRSESINKRTQVKS